jgi:hypothetical protein
LAGTWERDSVLDMRRDELPAMDREGAERLVAAFSAFMAERAPPPPPPAVYVPTPIVASGEKVLFGNLRARNALRDNGYEIAPVPNPGQSLPALHGHWGPESCDVRATCPVGILPSGLVVVELNWAPAPGNVELFAKLGLPQRGAEVAAGIERILREYVGEGLVAIRREAERATFVFRRDGSAFLREHGKKYSASRPDGFEMPNASVHVSCRTRGDPLVIGEGWSVDFLTTKRAALAPLAEHQVESALAEVVAWLKAGADLEKPQTFEPEPEAVAPRRGRKGAAAA